MSGAPPHQDPVRHPPADLEQRPGNGDDPDDRHSTGRAPAGRVRSTARKPGDDKTITNSVIIIVMSAIRALVSGRATIVSTQIPTPNSTSVATVRLWSRLKPS